MTRLCETLVEVLSEYDIVTPIHNEEGRVSTLVGSVKSQTLHPRRWCIVDDHSTDKTVALLRDSIREMDYAVITYRDSTGPAGWANTGIVMQYGIDVLASIGERLPEYVAVVDADIVLNSDYFEKIIRVIESATDHQKTAIASGLLADVDEDCQGQKSQVQELKWRPRGAARLYRYDFLRSVGGFPHCPSADDALVIKASNRGFRFEVVSEAKGLHLRRTPNMNRDMSNFGISSRVNGLDMLSVGLIFFSSIRRHGGESALAFLQGYLSEPQYRGARQTDPEVYGYFRHAWMHTFQTLIKEKKPIK